MSRRDTTALEVVVHLMVSATLTLIVYVGVDAMADSPWPALAALVFFAAYWGVFLFIDADGPSSGAGGGGGSSFLDSLF